MANKTLAEDLSDLPERLRELLPQLPEFVDDRAAAEIVSAHLYRISDRTIEIWPVPGLFLNGCVRRPTVEILREAQRRIDEAPRRRRGRASSPT